MAKRGRKTQLTPEVYAAIIDAIANGSFRGPAAKSAGVPERTFHSWMRTGKESKSGLYHNFCTDVLKAENAAEIKQLKLILEAAQKDPRHAQWWLERKFPERWASNRDQFRALANEVAELRKILTNGASPVSAETGSPTKDAGDSKSNLSS